MLPVMFSVLIALCFSSVRLLFIRNSVPFDKPVSFVTSSVSRLLLFNEMYILAVVFSPKSMLFKPLFRR